MSFSTTERDAIMGYLAWPATDDSRMMFDTALSQVSADSAAETRVKAILTAIAAIETQIDTARNTVGSAYTQLLAEGQRKVYQISNTLGLEVKRRVFGG